MRRVVCRWVFRVALSMGGWALSTQAANAAECLPVQPGSAWTLPLPQSGGDPTCFLLEDIAGATVLNVIGHSPDGTSFRIDVHDGAATDRPVSSDQTDQQGVAGLTLNPDGRALRIGIVPHADPARSPYKIVQTMYYRQPSTGVAVLAVTVFDIGVPAGGTQGPSAFDLNGHLRVFQALAARAETMPHATLVRATAMVGAFRPQAYYDLASNPRYRTAWSYASSVYGAAGSAMQFNLRVLINLSDAIRRPCRQQRCPAGSDWEASGGIEGLAADPLRDRAPMRPAPAPSVPLARGVPPPVI